MQLQAHLDGNRRAEELQLEEIKTDGVVIGHVDPDPDIDRLHIKVWEPTCERYICFLDAKFADTIHDVKRKIQEHPDIVSVTFKDMKVFYNGENLEDTDTIGQTEIEDDCILHCVDDHGSIPTLTVKSWSVKLHQWRELLPPKLKPPTRNEAAEKDLSPVPISSVVRKDMEVDEAATMVKKEVDEVSTVAKNKVDEVATVVKKEVDEVFTEAVNDQVATAGG